MTTALTTQCRKALSSMRNGMVPASTVGSDTREALKGLIWEVTEGYLELTPRGRGVDPNTFEAE